MPDTAAPTAPTDAADTPATRITPRAWYSLAILTLVYTFNNVDRRVASIVIEPLKN